MLSGLLGMRWRLWVRLSWIILMSNQQRSKPFNLGPVLFSPGRHLSHKQLKVNHEVLSRACSPETELGFAPKLPLLWRVFHCWLQQDDWPLFSTLVIWAGLLPISVWSWWSGPHTLGWGPGRQFSLGWKMKTEWKAFSNSHTTGY